MNFIRMSRFNISQTDNNTGQTDMHIGQTGIYIVQVDFDSLTRNW